MPKPASPRKTAQGAEAPRADQSKHLDSAAEQDFTPQAAADAIHTSTTGLQGALIRLGAADPCMALQFAIAGQQAAGAAVDTLHALAGQV